jgi:hypothetical protein
MILLFLGILFFGIRHIYPVIQIVLFDRRILSFVGRLELRNGLGSCGVLAV